MYIWYKDLKDFQQTYLVNSILNHTVLTGPEIATNWLPMWLKIECWRPEFQNWSAIGDFNFKENHFRITHQSKVSGNRSGKTQFWFFDCQCLLGAIWILQQLLASCCISISRHYSPRQCEIFLNIGFHNSMTSIQSSTCILLRNTLWSQIYHTC